ncbi:MAG: histidine kinase [Chitinophagaceae bacterium]|nr:histidine kinase [Chitinophagaceae bacterium]
MLQNLSHIRCFIKFLGIPLIGICLHTPDVYCQQYQFENYTTSNGLSDNRVTCFYKDRDGFMWIGTENGLNRFDGHSFLLYNAGMKKHILSNPYINDIEQDSNGRLWVATQNGLNVIDLEKDSTVFFTTNNDGYRQAADTIPSNLIWDTYIDHTGRVWLAADVRDLCYYDTLKKTFHYIPWKQYVTEKFPHRGKSYNSIRKIYGKSDNELWLGTSVGLFSYNIHTNTFTHHPGYEADVFISLQRAGNNIVYMQQPGTDIQVLKNEKEYRKIPVKDPSNDPGTFPADQLNDLLWFPAGKSLACINSLTGYVYFIHHITDNPYSLPAGNIRTAYRDNDGTIWVATDNGIGKFNPAMNFFPLIPVISNPFPGNEELDFYRIKHNVHTALYSSLDDRYYVSSPRFNCLYIIDKKSGKKQTITHAAGIPLKSCSVIKEKNEAELYILSGIRIFIYNRYTKKFRVLPFASTGKNLLFTDITEDAGGNLWIACYNDGLYRYDTIQHSVWKPSAKDSFNSMAPTSLYYDKARNKVWIGTFDYGVYDYDCSTHSFANYNKGSDSPEYIRSSLITDIIPDQYNNIWIATYADGIARLAFINGRPVAQKEITSADGLPENNIFSLTTDGEGNIWATTFRGLSKLDPEGKLLKNYNQNTGLPYTDFYSPFTVTARGELLTGVANGFICFKPDSLVHHPSPFKVAITSFCVRSNEQFNSADTSLPMVLAYFNNEVKFNFAALNYYFPSQTQYSYMLQGQDPGWFAGYQNSVTYNNLSPGSYIFKVKATDFNGNISSNEASISFRITPPLWQTWWFRLISATTIVTAIWLAFRARIKSVRVKAAINQQIAELKGQALRAQMNPHFIFNSLNAIQELIVTENYPASYQYLSKFSKLLRLVLNISEKNFIPLSQEIEMCNLYLELESLRFKHSFHYKIETGNIETDVVPFPTLLVQPFIENAIWHGLMQKEGKKNVEVLFTEKDDWITCTIRDNGIGRVRAAAIKASKIGSEHFTSKGILLARQRMDSLIAAGAGKGNIEITDCKDDAGYATGTEVKINFVVLKDTNT